jgi:hypothetical protein
MLRPVFMIAIAGLILAAVSGIAPAAPIAPPPAGMMAHLSDLTDVFGVAVGAIAGDARIAVAAGATGGAEFAAGEILQ